MKSNIEQILDNPIVKRYKKRSLAYLKIGIRWAKKNIPSFFRHTYGQAAAAALVIIILMLTCIFFQVGNRMNRTLYIVNIPRGYGATQVAELLESRGIIDGRYGFNLIVNMFRLQNRMQAGTYEFTPNTSLIRIVWKIKNGDIIPPMLVRLVFPEGISIFKMGRLMEREGVGDGIAFQGLTKTYLIDRFKAKYRFLDDNPTDSLEGYLFPDTYLVPSNIGTEQMADIMLSRFNNVIYTYWKKNKGRMKTKLDFHQVLTLASIVEKEAAIDSERSLIASVYSNRLRIRMQLGADPTIKYALERPGKIVSYDDLKINSPYNTYKYYGLPPGPICSPGLSSVKAAMFPARSDYLYFVARADGSHVFSKTWREHEQAKIQTRQDRVNKIYRQKQY